MDTNSRKLQIKILIADILQTGLTSENTPIVVDLLEHAQGEEVNALIFALEALDHLTPALKILILNYKLKELKTFLNLTSEDYINNREELIYIKQPRRFYKKLTEEEALKQVFLNLSDYPIIGETKFLIEQFDFFDSEDFIWKQCYRKYVINSKGRVVKFISETLTEIPDRPAPFINEDFTYSTLGKEYFQEEINEQDLLND